MISCRHDYMDVVVTPVILKLDKKSKSLRKCAGIEGLVRWHIHQEDFPVLYECRQRNVGEQTRRKVHASVFIFLSFEGNCLYLFICVLVFT